MLRYRFLVGMAGALILTACSSQGAGYDPNKGLILNGSGSGASSGASENETADSGSLTFGKLFGSSASGMGYAVGDEPYAVKAGAAVLDQGGSAADAAVAIYFTLAVTYSVAAGLGGGGLCVVYDADSGRSQAMDFLARDAAQGGAFAVPGNVRGFAALHAGYGKLPWQRDVALGESMAASGFPVSDALAARLQASQNVVRLDTNLSAEFLDESGHVKPAGTVVANPALAGTLALIRERGPDAFYGASIAEKIVRYSSREGGAISAADLAAYRAGVRDPQIVTMGSQRAYLPPVSVGAGSFAAAMLPRLVNAGGTPRAAGDAAVATSAAVKATLAKFGVASLPEDLGATGYAALDKNGQAVACAVTMNGPFGSGHTAEGTGVALANSPSAGQAGLAAAFLMPVLATTDDNQMTLAGAGAGGPNGTAAIVYALLELALGKDVTKPGDLRSTGAAPYDTVNAIACQHGICAALPDPAAHGLGVSAGG